MNFAQLLIKAFGYDANDQGYEELYKGNPLTTREMYAVSNNRSLTDVARSIVHECYAKLLSRKQTGRSSFILRLVVDNHSRFAAFFNVCLPPISEVPLIPTR